MTSHHRIFKETQFFDWDSEPALERSSTIFHDETPLHRRVRRPKRLSLRGAWLVVCAVAFGSGALALIHLVPVIAHRL